MTKHNAKEVDLHVHHQRETLGYSQERLAEPSEISNSFLSDIERDDQGFSVTLLARLARILGLSADCILSGTEQVTSIGTITDMSSSLDRKYLPRFREPLGAYLRTITIAKKQDD